MKNNHFKIFANTYNKFFLTAIFLLLVSGPIFSQRILGDCTIYYSVTYRDKDSLLVNALKTVYIRGAQVRSDFSYGGSNYLQSIFQNNNTGNVQVLKEIGTNKYKTSLDSTEWRIRNNIYNNLKTTFDDNDVKVILGYRCGRARLTLENGHQYNVYYTLDVVPSCKENKYQFKDVPGIILQYESIAESAANPIVIKAKSINLMPISEYMFKVPVKGYRVTNDF